MWQEIDYIEYFAGVGNITKQMKAARYRAARFDIKDHKPTKTQKSNYMDLNSASGYALLWLEQNIPVVVAGLVSNYIEWFPHIYTTVFRYKRQFL